MEKTEKENLYQEMLQAANDPLFIEDLRDCMIAFANVDLVWEINECELSQDFKPGIRF